MKNSIVKVYNDDLVVGTWDLSKGFEVEHRSLKRLIKKYQSEFEELGVIATPLQQPSSRKGGRGVQEYMLNEPQATYLTTLLTNNSIVRKFKLHLTKEFFRQRRFLYRLMEMASVQKKNAEWIQKRSEGKIERKIETDTIKKFVEYAILQGSQSASKYYMVISKMENESLFNLEFAGQKFPNLREVVNGFALDSLKMADHIVAKALKEGMSKNMNYRDIYILARDRVQNFGYIMGKTPIQEVIYSNNKYLN